MIDEVRLERANHVARVTIDRPRVLNAIDSGTQARLNAIWDEIECDPDVRVVILTGAGDRAFCAGADMSEQAIKKTGLEYWASTDRNGFGGLSLRTTLRVPVIGRVNGYALGGGMVMLLGCDIIVAAEHAKFGMTEPRVGRLPLEGGISGLVRRIPYVHAMGLLLTGRMATADEMAHIGFVNEVVAPAELDKAIDRWVSHILACSPACLRAIKEVVQRAGHLPLQEADALRLPALMAALTGPDSVEGVRAFRERRPPAWSSQ